MEIVGGFVGGFGGGGEVSAAAAAAAAAAAFVIKTYRMVNDPSTDAVISWGKENNSFVVLDPFLFSQTLLPSHFKHNNFSSFVRQLNTYGFRKVDPDRWEFAHSSFLRGQMQLLRHIVRRSTVGGGGRRKEEEEELEAAAVAAEVVKLKKEQNTIEERVEGMWKRVQETERRPRQMLAFLMKVVGDPATMGRLMERAAGEEAEGGAGAGAGGWEKRARLRLDGASTRSGDVAPAGGFYGGEATGELGTELGVGGWSLEGIGGGYPYSFSVNNGF